MAWDEVTVSGWFRMTVSGLTVKGTYFGVLSERVERLLPLLG